MNTRFAIWAAVAGVTSVAITIYVHVGLEAADKISSSAGLVVALLAAALTFDQVAAQRKKGVVVNPEAPTIPEARRFIEDLRRLRGNSSFKEVGAHMGRHGSFLARRLVPTGPLPSLEFVKAYTTACGADPVPWVDRWSALARATMAAAPSRRKKSVHAVARIVVLAAVVIAGVWVTEKVLSTPTGPVPSLVIPTSSPAASPSPVTSGHGFPITIESMTMRIFSGDWTQTVSGNIEIWSNLTCPSGVTTYWMALRPIGTVAQFTCNSWQHHKWVNVPAGFYHFEIWKQRDGQTVMGTALVHTSTPITFHPKLNPPVSKPPAGTLPGSADPPRTSILGSRSARNSPVPSRRLAPDPLHHCSHRLAIEVCHNAPSAGIRTGDVR
ncbi:helix-turn-helix domain-containing protein [Streptosporangium sp. NBC_01810]|uniref:hypothetical protein n=1 Tax=Streptosporangium sp. NBC_01810 TaxID=2975951 RepID=UPI002DDBFF76|nr:hypothetical protein [Streptosporangium sp. NBC_01810]WSA26735.1 helix-turn-helix domain-containing protein [Streptosporangium sp. NBC_01810]